MWYVISTSICKYAHIAWLLIYNEKGNLYGFALPCAKSSSRNFQRNASGCVAGGAMETKGNYMVLPSPMKKVCPESFGGMRQHASQLEQWKPRETNWFCPPLWKKFVPNCSEELVVGGALGSKGNCMVLSSPVTKVCPHMFRGLSLNLVIRKRSRNLLSVALPLHEGNRFGILMSSSWRNIFVKTADEHKSRHDRHGKDWRMSFIKRNPPINVKSACCEGCRSV